MIADRGVSSALDSAVAALAVAGYPRRLRDAAESLWWLQHPYCI